MCEQPPHDVLTFNGVTKNKHLRQLPDDLLLNSVSVAQMCFTKVDISHFMLSKRGRGLCLQLPTFYDPER